VATRASAASEANDLIGGDGLLDSLERQTKLLAIGMRIFCNTSQRGVNNLCKPLS
jgi:hypothetical protein